jgi:fluoroquinolone transport system ATP-binding protein
MLEVKNLRYSYNGGKDYAVDGISFSVSKGETFGFLGPNGAGKSTTQKILTGLLPMQQGSANVAGIDVNGQKSKFFNKIGVSFEIANAYNKLTGLENLEYFAGLFDVPTRDPGELLKLVGLEEAVNMKVGEYSKGMKQRLIFARSLLNDPEMLFLDEPISGLDPTSARNIKNVIKGIKDRGTTIFLTTHDMHIADELCDRVAFLDEGKIVVLDTPRNLKLRFGQKIINVEYNDNGKTAEEQISLIDDTGWDRLHVLMKEGKVETVHSKEATLEHVFIELTGRGLD